MLSRQFIREHPDEVREAARKKHVDLPLDRLLALDARVEDLKRESQARREESNRVSKSTGKAAPGDRAGYALTVLGDPSGRMAVLIVPAVLLAISLLVELWAPVLAARSGGR